MDDRLRRSRGHELSLRAEMDAFQGSSACLDLVPLDPTRGMVVVHKLARVLPNETGQFAER